VKGKKILAALTAVLVVSLLGCGDPAIGNLQTITISANSTNLVGEGGTLQLHATGVYSTGQRRDLTSRVTFTASVTPGSFTDGGVQLPTPPATVMLNATGLVTAVAPFVCTWVDTTPASTTPSWAISGSYTFMATFGSVSSQPIFVSVASAAPSDPNNTTGKCGPS